MALLNPSWDIIENLQVPPTVGERRLLNFLVQELDDSYEIFFQPFLNGDCPDIAILRRNSGVLFIEVKDWDLRNYYVDTDTNWRLRKNDAHICSPLKQVDQYRKHLFEMHVAELYHRTVTNPKVFTVIKCAVYFDNATEQELRSFVTKGFIGTKYNTYNRWLQYMQLLGKDSLNDQRLTVMMYESWMSRTSYFFDQPLYDSIRRHLKPPFHRMEEGIPITYSAEQQALVPSEQGQRRKIKGIAGCGKTFVLARRAVNAYLRTRSRVLVLTYNLSLKNYIHDRISEVRENFPWNYFFITNYHQFFKIEANNYNLEITSLSCWQQVNFFETIKDEIEGYDAIFIDEIQDYRQEWLDIVTNYFMRANTEFVVFGDEKQNIYERKMDDHHEPIVKMVPGRWNRSLKKSYRLDGIISDLAVRFQREVFNARYEPDDMDPPLNYEQQVVKYNYVDRFDPGDIVRSLYNVLRAKQIHSSDVGVLCSQIDILREIDYSIRQLLHENTTTTFESKEEWMTIKEEELTKLRERGVPEDQAEESAEAAADDRAELIRRGRKNFFWYNTGSIKLSTVHSFKGWEAHTLVLIIPGPENGARSNEELVYTGLTRARKNLLIWNLGDLRYHAFFNRVVAGSQ